MTGPRLVIPFNGLRRDEVNYLLTFAPILLSHLVVPTLSYLAGTEDSPLFNELYDLFPGFTRQYVESLLLDPTRHKLFKDPQWFTYLFVHGTYTHMLGNLYTAYVCGRPVYFEFGPMGLFFLFFSGGVVSCLPSRFSNDHQRNIRKAIKESFVIRNQPFMPGFLKDVWNSFVPTVGERIVGIQLPTRVCGSSGAVCALLGASTLLGLRDLFRSPSVQNFLADHFWRKRNATSNRRRAQDEIVVDLHFANHIYSIATSIAYLIHEYHIIYNSSHDLPGPFYERLASILEKAQVGHAAHLQGALYGASVAALLGIALPYLFARGPAPRVAII